MTKTENITYRVRDKGGPMGGQKITFEAPVFDLQEFLRTPNAGEFIKKAYDAAVKKIAREVEERKNGSLRADLGSYEMIVARSLKFTKADIIRWLETRDWTRIESIKDPVAMRKNMENWLPRLALRVNYLPEDPSRTVALKLVADLADKTDPIADYLFVVLTVDRPQDIVDISAL